MLWALLLALGVPWEVCPGLALGVLVTYWAMDIGGEGHPCW